MTISEKIGKIIGKYMGSSLIATAFVIPSILTLGVAKYTPMMELFERAKKPEVIKDIRDDKDLARRIEEIDPDRQGREFIELSNKVLQEPEQFVKIPKICDYRYDSGYSFDFSDSNRVSIDYNSLKKLEMLDSDKEIKDKAFRINQLKDTMTNYRQNVNLGKFLGCFVVYFSSAVINVITAGYFLGKVKKN